MKYIDSSKDESSALGWETVRKQIKSVSNREFLDHFKRFYESEDKPVERRQRPGILNGLGTLTPAVVGSEVLQESKSALTKIALLSLGVVIVFWWVKNRM